MKAISVRLPWAWLIAHGHKDVENRSRRWHYRGEFAIHASATMTDGEYMDCYTMARSNGITLLRADQYEVMLGRVLAIATLSDCVKYSVSPWFVGPYGLVMTNVRCLAVPQLARGMLGLWEWEPAGALEERGGLVYVRGAR